MSVRLVSGQQEGTASSPQKGRRGELRRVKGCGPEDGSGPAEKTQKHLIREPRSKARPAAGPAVQAERRCSRRSSSLGGLSH